jgi:hypothetical protein
MAGVSADALGRFRVSGNVRVVVQAYDQLDGSAARRRLGLYRVGYELIEELDLAAEPWWTLKFRRLPTAEAVRSVYAPGSKSGATGETIFRYIVTNRVDGDEFREGFLQTGAMEPGVYLLRLFAADQTNVTRKDIYFEVVR